MCVCVCVCVCVCEVVSNMLVRFRPDIHFTMSVRQTPGKCKCLSRPECVPVDRVVRGLRRCNSLIIALVSDIFVCQSIRHRHKWVDAICSKYHVLTGVLIISLLQLDYVACCNLLLIRRRSSAFCGVVHNLDKNGVKKTIDLLKRESVDLCQRKSIILLHGKSIHHSRFGQKHRSCDGETVIVLHNFCLLYTSPSPRDGSASRMPSSA